MTPGLWSREEIRNCLLALNQANRDMARRMAAQMTDTERAQIYRDGYGDALRAVAVAFGVAIPHLLPEPLPSNVPLPQHLKEAISVDSYGVYAPMLASGAHR
ncbi:MAG: hypothetical protein HY259_15320 [Chloroflexi bacterium]|nr:hypothetical protein [Chloroflexota bacterium]